MIGMECRKAKTLKKHLPYEIEMLWESMILMQKRFADRTIRNALIESFCMHGRNLMEFFWRESAECRYAKTT
jgi:hypothetical protein